MDLVWPVSPVVVRQFSYFPSPRDGSSADTPTFSLLQKIFVRHGDGRIIPLASFNHLRLFHLLLWVCHARVVDPFNKIRFRILLLLEKIQILVKCS